MAQQTSERSAQEAQAKPFLVPDNSNKKASPTKGKSVIESMLGSESSQPATQNNEQHDMSSQPAVPPEVNKVTGAAREDVIMISDDKEPKDNTSKTKVLPREDGETSPA